MPDRDPTIYEFLAELQAFWEEHPNLRFGQLITTVYPQTSRLYDVDDHEFLRHLGNLRAFFGESTPPKKTKEEPKRNARQDAGEFLDNIFDTIEKYRPIIKTLLG